MHTCVLAHLEIHSSCNLIEATYAKSRDKHTSMSKLCQKKLGDMSIVQVAHDKCRAQNMDDLNNVDEQPTRKQVKPFNIIKQLEHMSKYNRKTAHADRNIMLINVETTHNGTTRNAPRHSNAMIIMEAAQQVGAVKPLPL